MQESTEAADNERILAEAVNALLAEYERLDKQYQDALQQLAQMTADGYRQRSPSRSTMRLADTMTPLEQSRGIYFCPAGGVVVA